MCMVSNAGKHELSISMSSRQSWKTTAHASLATQSAGKSRLKQQIPNVKSITERWRYFVDFLHDFESFYFPKRFIYLCGIAFSGPYVSVKSKLQHSPPGHTPGIWRLFLPGREGIWSPTIEGGEFDRSPRCHDTARTDSTWVDECHKSWRRQRRRQTLMNSKEKIGYLWRIGWKPKAYTSCVPYL